MQIQANVGKADRMIRLLAGMAIIAAGVYYQSWWGAVGIVPIATALINWCPLYAPFGISTCGKDEKS